MQRFHTIKIENRRTFQISHSYLISTHNTLGLESECECMCARARSREYEKQRSIKRNNWNQPPSFATFFSYTYFKWYHKVTLIFPKVISMCAYSPVLLFLLIIVSVHTILSFGIYHTIWLNGNCVNVLQHTASNWLTKATRR